MDPTDLQHRFAFHPADEATGRRHGAIRDKLGNVAGFLDGLLPDGREKSLAITKLEEAMMWASAALARERLLAAVGDSASEQAPAPE